MTQILSRPSMPSDLLQPYCGRTVLAHSSPRMLQPARPLHVIDEENSERRRQAEWKRREELALREGTPNQKVVVQWLAGTSEVSPQERRPPPLNMNGGGPNSMLAPTYGGLYNGVGTAKASATAKQEATNSHERKGPLGTCQPSYSNSSQPPSPRQSNPNTVLLEPARRRRSSGDNQIVSYLQIPSSINNSKGSLAEFAAQITCLFWFESSFTLHRVEESPTTPTPTEPLVLEAIPTTGFRKWVTTMLSTTQVTQNVILLALMFIYRLKKLNPTVKGKPGSEFRLLTVALMLGNKFLDDNTYTNKTWAEVSGISVQEIHIMEVEFLSNMRYTLYASEQQWNLWHIQLGRFWEYFDKASKTSPESKAHGQASASINNPYALPSPPTSLHTSPPFTASRTPSTLHQLHPLSMPPYLAPSIPAPVAKMPDVDLTPYTRKRTFDDQTQEPPAKRLARPYSSSENPALTPTSSMTLLGSSGYLPRLPIPNLSISTNNPMNMYQGSYSAHLPPPTARAMSIVYPNHQSTGGLLTPSQPTQSFSTLPPMNDQLRRPSNSGSRTTSPTAGNFGQSTQDLLSPSGYPIQRSSPYRPLRSVNTLLVPPPPASLHNPSQNVGYNNMHYQPLGKPLSERKTGVVPFMSSDYYQQQVSQQSIWPSLPQPTPSQPIYRI